GVPSGSRRESLKIVEFLMRMHPWLTSWPTPVGSFVPCSPIRPSPPKPKRVKTFECAESPKTNAPYTEPASIGRILETMKYVPDGVGVTARPTPTGALT